MNRKLLPLLALLVFVLLPSYAAGDLIGVTHFTPVKIVRINEATGVGTVIGTTPEGGLNSLAKSSTGTLYSASFNWLLIINPTTGTSTRVADLIFANKFPDVVGLAFSPRDVLYALLREYDEEGHTYRYLYTVNVTTGVATLIGQTRSGVDSITFSPSGDLYGWDNAWGLVIIDPTTAEAKDVNPEVGATADIQGIAFGPEGVLYGARDALYAINPKTGVCTLVGSGGYSDIRGIESVPASTPYALIGGCFSSTNSPVVRINPYNGTGAPIGLSGKPGFNSLAKNSAGTLYSTSGGRLVTINSATGAATPGTTLDFGGKPADVRGLAFSPQNVLFAVINDDGPSGIGPHYLYTVNVSTGVATLIGQTGDGVQSIAFARSGVLYGWDIYLGLVTINTTTGTATDVNPAVGGDAYIQGIVFGPDDVLYGARDSLFQIDPLTGVRGSVGGWSWGDYSDVRGLEFVELSPPDTMIGVSWSDTSSATIKINHATGTGTTTGLTGFPHLDSLARDNVGNLYSVSGDKLIVVNPTTGAGAPIATLYFPISNAEVRGLAFPPGGYASLYAVIYDRDTQEDYLYYISIGPWHLYNVGPIEDASGRYSGIQSIAFSPTGTLYGWDVKAGLITINTSTAFATKVNPAVPGDEEVKGIVFGPDGTLYGAGNALYTIAPATGARTLVGSGGYSNVRGLEFAAVAPYSPKRLCIAPILLELLLGE